MRVLLLLAWWALLASTAQAQAPLSLESLDGVVELAPRVELLRDPAGKLRLEDVRVAGTPFVFDGRKELSLGFDYDAIWLRFVVRNDGERAIRWALEVAEPTLDHVDLYVLHADGREERKQSGDMLPFSERAIGHATFLFDMSNSPGDVDTYYLRVQSDDVLRVPLRAWTISAYAAHHEREEALAWLFLGTLVMSFAYNIGVVALVRQIENFWYALVSLSFAGVLLALRGTLGQLFLSDQPELANRLVPVSLALALLNVTLFIHAVVVRIEQLPITRRVLRRLLPLLAGLVIACFVAPVGLALRGMALLVTLVCLAGPAILALTQTFHVAELRPYRYGWYPLILAIPVTCMRYAGLCPDAPWSEWALALSFVVHGLMTSLALALLANTMRRAITAMNEQLVQNVRELQQALTRAEEANESAQRATKAKDEFVATMSHELRTPLNAIINIPQGLIGEFVTVRSARCSQCRASFLLDDADEVDASTRCQSCHQQGTLVEGEKVKYRGDEARCLRFLQKIERSGQHLLQMVNGVLDYSKLEAGRFELMLAPVELDALIREVGDQMSEIAQRKNIQLEIVPNPADRRLMMADVLRLRQVLINLVANAIKFSEPDTTVTVRWLTLADSEQIEVQDRGIGIAPVDQARIFTSFEQVHKGDTRKYGGTGLGLSISRSLVRMHGGELTVRSTLGEGSTFVVRLPRMAASAAGPDNTNVMFYDSRPLASSPRQ